eukprot:scaffold12029_cov59-Attheya_sp.AAC.2
MMKTLVVVFLYHILQITQQLSAFTWPVVMVLVTPVAATAIVGRTITRNKALHWIYLTENNIGSDGAKAIAPVGLESNTTL